MLFEDCRKAFCCLAFPDVLRGAEGAFAYASDAKTICAPRMQASDKPSQLSSATQLPSPAHQAQPAQQTKPPQLAGSTVCQIVRTVWPCWIKQPALPPSLPQPSPWLACPPVCLPARLPLPRPARSSLAWRAAAARLRLPSPARSSLARRAATARLPLPSPALDVSVFRLSRRRLGSNHDWGRHAGALALGSRQPRAIMFPAQVDWGHSRTKLAELRIQSPRPKCASFMDQWGNLRLA